MNKTEIENQAEQQVERKKLTKAQVNFRAPEDLASWIKAFSKENRQSQEDIIVEALESYRLKTEEDAFPSRCAELAEFKSRILELHRMYVVSVAMCENTQNRVREEFRVSLASKDRSINDYQEQITALQGRIEALGDADIRVKALQLDLDSARAQIREVESDTKRRIGDLRTTNDSLMADKKRLEAEVQKLLEQISSMQAAVASFNAMRDERDAAIAKNDAVQKQAVEATRAAMQDQINAVNDRLHEAVVAQAAAQAEANTLKEFKLANNLLHETVGEQKAKISMLEEQISVLRAQIQEKNRGVDNGAVGKTPTDEPCTAFEYSDYQH